MPGHGFIIGIDAMLKATGHGPSVSNDTMSKASGHDLYIYDHVICSEMRGNEYIILIGSLPELLTKVI